MSTELVSAKQRKKDFVIGGLLGLAVGDAFGVPVEFLSKEEVSKIGLEDMAGCDTKDIPSRWGEIIEAGAWSDDTSMTVAEVASLIENKGKIDYEDIMIRFCRWWRFGDYTALGHAFGLGGCVSRALDKFVDGISPLKCGGTKVKDNGNGSLMRIFPFSAMCILNGYDDDITCKIIGDASAITHAHEISKLSCFIYTLFLRECLKTGDPLRAYKRICFAGENGFRKFYGKYFSREAVRELEGIRNIAPEEIPESGYVVDSLKVAIYSVLYTDNYEDAVKMAVGFGYDTDTNAAIAGSIAGALYGVESIPGRWLKVLKKKKYLREIASAFARCIIGKQTKGAVKWTETRRKRKMFLPG